MPARWARSRSGPSGFRTGGQVARARPELPGTLVRGLLGWHGDTDAVLAEWLWCRQHPAGRAARVPLRARLGRVPGRAASGAARSASRRPGTPPRLDLVEAAALYQTLYWVARTAAAPTPPADVLHVTAAGWSAIPALVHKALHGTPMVLTEHGVYLREAYLAAVRGGGPPGARFAATRLARGLARAAYAGADVICPVTDANAYWEMGLGIDPAKILVLYNGLRQPAAPVPPPGARVVVSVGRIDPAQGRPHAAARGRGDAAAGPATRASGTTARSRTARRPTGARASRCTSASASASASASWAARRTPTASCGPRTWC